MVTSAFGRVWCCSAWLCVAPQVTIQRSGRKLLLATFFLFVFALLFAACIYAVELGTWDAASQTYVDVTGAPSSFPNMFRCLWLAIVTMTSVGYGGISPVTFVGKLTCVLAAVCGSFYIAVPLTVIGNKFYDSYKMYRQVCDTSRQQRTLASSAALPSAGLY